MKLAGMLIFKPIQDLMRLLFLSKIGNVSISRLMALISFVLNIFLQAFTVLNDKDSFIELIVANYAFILTLLGIKGYFDYKFLGKSNQNGNGEEAVEKVEKDEQKTGHFSNYTGF